MRDVYKYRKPLDRKNVGWRRQKSRKKQKEKRRPPLLHSGRTAIKIGH